MNTSMNNLPHDQTSPFLGNHHMCLIIRVPAELSEHARAQLKMQKLAKRLHVADMKWQTNEKFGDPAHSSTRDYVIVIINQMS